jgi:hypothetical protein
MLDNDIDILSNSIEIKASDSQLSKNIDIQTNDNNVNIWTNDEISNIDLPESNQSTNYLLDNISSLASDSLNINSITISDQYQF